MTSTPLFRLVSSSTNINNLAGDEVSYASTADIFYETLRKPYDIFENWDEDQPVADTLVLIDIPCFTMARSSDAIRDHLNSEFIKAVEPLGVKFTESEFDLADFQGVIFLNRTYECALASCSSDSMGSCNDDFQAGAAEFFGKRSSDWAFLGDEYCTGIQVKINLDLAGPGVMVSYIFQTSLALFAWFSIQLLTLKSTLEFLKSPYFLWPGDRSHTGRSLAKRLSKVAAPLRAMQASNIAHSTIAFITEFQEAQSFFVIGIAIAIMHAETQSASFNNVENWQSLRANEELLANLSSIGVHPLVLTQLILHQLSETSVYSLTCSTLATMIAGVNMIKMKEATATKVHEMFADKTGIPECGDTPSLRTYCRGEKGYAADSSPMLFPWLAVLGVLWVIKIWSIVSKIRNPDSHEKSKDGGRNKTALKERLSPVWNYTRAFAALVVTIGTFIAQIWLVVLVIQDMKFLAKDNYSGTVGTAWNVGQIVAMLVWAPVISKYLYTILFGIERGFAIRLSSAFMVSRKVEEIRKSGDRPNAREAQDASTALMEGDRDGVRSSH